MKQILIIFQVLLSVGVMAQTAKKDLVGSVKDEKGNKVEHASVELFRIRDSVLIQTVMADEAGIFKYHAIDDGTYFIVTTCTGYLKKRSLNFTIQGSKIPFDTLLIRLARSTIQLANVTVTAKKSIIENKIDKTIINVDAFLNTAGTSLLEVLGNSPNVDVDINGTINLKGKLGVLILIDGKQNYLSGAALTNYLNSIPASQVDQVEIMSQPPAKYDASGNSGVINIKMKKNKQVGFNANISLSYMQGFYPRTLNSVSIDYRIRKFNFFFNGDFDYIKRYTHRRLSRYIQDSLRDIQYFQDENDISRAPGHSLRAGIDLYPNKDWTFSLLYGNKLSGQENEVTDHSSFYDLDQNGKPVSYLEGYNVIRNPWINNSVSLNAKRQLSANNDWTADLDYENYRFSSQQNLTSFSYDSFHQLIPSALNPYIQWALLPVKVNIVSAKTDLSLSFGHYRIETGLKSSFIESNNNSSFYFMENDSVKQDNNLTNFYNYRENINAAYINFHWQFKKWELQGGLRTEETNSSGFQKIGEEGFSRSYWQVFPTLYLGFTPDQNNNLSFSYGRRVDRPNYLDLNPFLYLIDQYTYRKGNPGLNPYFSNDVELDYNYKGSFHADLDYGVSKGIVDNILYQDDSTKILLQTPANLNTLTTIALNLNYTFSIKSWTTFILSYNIFNYHYKGRANNIAIDKGLTTNLLNFTEQFHFKKGWSAELSIVYRDKFLLSSVSTRGPRKMSSFAIGKTIMKNKGSLKLRVTDPFYIQQSYGSTLFGNIHSTTSFNEDSRRIGITFTYRFQKGIKNSQRKLYSPEENNRVIQN